MKKTIVVGTGRCGTRGFAKAFGGVHEYKTFERYVGHERARSPRRANALRLTPGELSTHEASTMSRS